MKKQNLILTFLVLSFLKTFSQDKLKEIDFLDVAICGKSANDQDTQRTYFIGDLNNCDWKISTIDPNYEVTEFKITIIPKDNSKSILEYEIKGNTIPEKYRTEILTHSEKVFVEYIKAEKNKGDRIPVKPFVIKSDS
jgi:hypothetical protein